MLKAQSYLLQKYSEIRPLDGALLRDALAWIFDADKKEHVTLLEPGCGPGRVLKELSRHPKVSSLVGIDIIPELVEMAKKAIEEPCRIEKGDFLTYDFKKEQFDYILFSHYFHHLQKDEVPKHIEKAKKLLKKPGGRILLLFEDCPYYSFLLGYPPATPPSHPLTKLYETIHKDKNLDSIFRRKAFYLPHELADSGKMAMHVAPILRYSQVKKDINWTQECQNKSASIFHGVSVKKRNRLAALNGELKLALTVQPYLFYSGKRLHQRSIAGTTGNRSAIPLQSVQSLTRSTLIDILQLYIQQVFISDPIAFLSVYPESPHAINRDVYFGGALPRAELACWYYDSYNSKVAHLVGSVPELSPAFLVAQKFTTRNPFPLKVTSAQILKKSLLKVYESYEVLDTVKDEVAEYSRLLWQSITLLKRLLQFTHYQVEGLHYEPLMYGPHGKHGFSSILTIKKPSGMQVDLLNSAMHWFRGAEKKITEDRNVFIEIKERIKKDANQNMPWFDSAHPLVKHTYPQINDVQATAQCLENNGLILPNDFNSNKWFYDGGLRGLLLPNDQRRFSSIYALILIAMKQAGHGNIQHMKGEACEEEPGPHPHITEEGLNYLYDFFINIVKHKEDSSDAILRCGLSKNAFTVTLKDDFMMKVLETTMSILYNPETGGRHKTSKPLANFIKKCDWRLFIEESPSRYCIFNHNKTNGDLNVGAKDHISFIRFSKGF